MLTSSSVKGRHIQLLGTAMTAAVPAACAKGTQGVAPLRGVAQIDPIRMKVDALIKKMTLEEKVMQMVQPAWGGAITGPTKGDDAVTAELVKQGLGSLLNVGTSTDVNRLQRLAMEESKQKIPLLVCHDVIYGDRTIGPVPLAMACSFDPEVARAVALVAGKEARARGVALTFAPMLDISHDPRWGRVVEGWGSSPYLTSVMGAANINGFKLGGVATCAKHFAGYGFPDGGVDYAAAQISPYRFENEVIPPFRRAIAEGGESVMPGFSSVDGVPPTLDKDLLTGRLRKEWGGEDVLVITDYTAIMELIHHGVVDGPKDAARLAALAGVDMDMESGLFKEHLADLVREGAVPEKIVDDANRRILTLKMKLGLFENPYVDTEAEKKVVLCDEHKQTMLRAAERSMVLLKNEAPAGGDPLLPLKETTKRIAVIGPLAAGSDILGQWRSMGRAEETTTILEGILERAPNATIQYAKGCRANAPGSKEMLEEAIKAAEESEVVIAVLGETTHMSGEATTRPEPDLPQAQLDMLKELHERTGKPIVVVLTNGRPLTNLGWIKDNIPSVLEAWQPGTMGGTAVANVLFGSDGKGRNVNPGGKLASEIYASAGYIGGAHHNRYATGRPTDIPGANGKYTSGPAFFDGDGVLIDGDPRHVNNDPLYSFGFGQSYTTFEVGGPEVVSSISRRRLRDDGMTVKVTVSNTGDREGDEVVQLYVRDVVASQVQPLKRLVGFERVTLAAGETRTVEFQLSDKDLEFFNTRQKKAVLEPGEFKLWAGSSSRDVDCKTANFKLVDEGASEGRWWEVK